jgi:dTDP-4-amino-4,6-dideoxygalactose transaminase
MGKYSSLIFDKLEFAFDSMFLKASEIHKSLEASLNENKDLLPVHEQNGEIFITPRFSLYVKKELVEKVILMGRQNKIEISRWFYESPPNYMLEKCRISSNKNALKVADHIINLPAYWTLSAQEIRKLKEFIKFLNENEYLVKL